MSDASLESKLRTTLGPLIELLLTKPAESSETPAQERTEHAAAPSGPSEDERLEAEFAARLREEQEEELREALKAEKSEREAALRKFQSGLKNWQSNMESTVETLKSRQSLVINAPPVVLPAIPVSEPKSLSKWHLEVVSRENGLMRTVVGTSGNRRISMTITRTPDGYPKAIDIQPE